MSRLNCHFCGEIPQNHSFFLSVNTLTNAKRVRYILVSVEIESIPRGSKLGVEPSDQIRGNFGRKGGVVNWQS